MPKNKDLIFVVLLALLNLVAVLLGVESPWVRIPLGLPLVLIVPGYALTAAIFPEKEIGFAVRALFILGLSLSSAVLGGLLLNTLPSGLTAISWSALLFIVSTLSIFVAWIRRRQVGWAEIRTPELPGGSIGGKLESQSQKTGFFPRLGAKSYASIVMVGLAVFIALGAFVLARIPASHAGQQGYTLLWLMPDGNNSGGQLGLGVQSMEFERTTYRVEIRSNGLITKVLSDIVLDPEQKWEITLNTAEVSPTGGAVEALLFRTDNPNTIYRQVKVWTESKVKSN